MQSLNVIKVIIADDHQLVRSGIKLLLETDPEISITSEAISGKDVLDQLNEKNYADIILTDFHMPDMSGMELLEQIKDKHPTMRVIFLTMVEDESVITSAFASGADGYLTKDITAEELIFAINHVQKGGKYISASLHRFFIKSLQVMNVAMPETASLDFNPREIEVLELISEGLTNSEMGEKLFLSKRTVEGHRRALIDKTQCRNSAALIKYAVTHGLIR